MANGKIPETPPELRLDVRSAIFHEELRKRTTNASVADPTGGGTVDTECRAQLVALMDAMRASGILDT